MDIEMIKIFLKLTEVKSLTKTAEELHLTQSTISHRLQQMEEEIGVPLVLRARGKRTLELTDAGTDFIALAERWYALHKETQQFQYQSQQDILHIATIDSPNVFALGPLYQRIAEDPYIPIRLYLHTYQSFQVFDGLERHEIDMGFVVRIRQSRNMILEPLFRERHYLVGRLGSDKKIIDPRTLNPQLELLTNWGPNFLAWHDLYFVSTIAQWLHVAPLAFACQFFLI